MNELAHLGIMFHHFHNENINKFDFSYPSGQGAMSQDELDRLLRAVGVENILSPLDWLESLKRASSVSSTRYCLTFDDNLLCQYRLAIPVLESLNLQAFFFVNTGPWRAVGRELELYRYFRTTQFDNIDDFYQNFFQVCTVELGGESYGTILDEFDHKTFYENSPYYSFNDKLYRYLRDKVLSFETFRALMNVLIEKSSLEVSKVLDQLWMSPSEICQLVSKGHIVGLHSHSHPTCMMDLPMGEQQREYQTNLNILNECTSIPVLTMSHPSDSYSAETLDMLRSLGVAYGFRAVPLENADPLLLPRISNSELLTHFV